MVLRLVVISGQSARENVVASIRNNQPNYILHLSALGQNVQTCLALRDRGMHKSSRSHLPGHLSPVMG